MSLKQILEEINWALKLIAKSQSCSNDPDLNEALRYLANACKEIVAKLPEDK